MWLLRARWTVVIDLNLIDSFSMVVNIVLQVTESWPMTWDQSVKRCIPLLPVCRERAKTQVLAVLLQLRVKRRLNGKGSFWNTLYATPRVRALWTVITNTVRTKESVRVFFFCFANFWMFYQEALPKFQCWSCVNSLLTIGDRHWRK